MALRPFKAAQMRTLENAKDQESELKHHNGMCSTKSDETGPQKQTRKTRVAASFWMFVLAALYGMQPIIMRRCLR